MNGWRAATRRGSPVLGAIVALLLFATPASALDSPGDSQRWDATISNGVVPSPEACSDQTCQTRKLSVDLPASERRNRGLMVTIHWPETKMDIAYDLDLYVYGPDGDEVAHSDMLNFSSDEAAWVQDPKNGTYRVVVVPKTLAGSLDYRGFARFERGYTVPEDMTFEHTTPDFPDLVMLGQKPDEPRPMLPDLVPRKAFDWHIESAVGGQFYLTGSRGLNHQPSCYPQETVGVDQDDPSAGPTGALRCLRWDSQLLNYGDGPYELRTYPNSNSSDAYQVIYKSDGSYTERKVGNVEFHVAHGHFHFQGFETEGLFTIKPDGTPGKQVSELKDKGRCAVDTQDPRFGEEVRFAPIHYVVPGSCDQNDEEDPNDTVAPGDDYFRTGLSVGWADTYMWYLPDQYADITNVADGRYLLIDRVNENGALREIDPSNDVSAACVDIEGNSATTCPVPAAAKRKLGLSR
jgi:hypothetical protein